MSPTGTDCSRAASAPITAEQLGCTVVPMSGGQTERQVQLITDFKADIIMVTPSYVLEVSRENNLDRLLVRVESNPLVSDQPALCEQAGRDLQHLIKSFIGVSASVVVCPPGSVERSVGKAKRVIDRRNAATG